MDWTNPPLFNWDENPPLSARRDVTLTSMSYVVFVVISTFISRQLLSLENKQTMENAQQKTSKSWKPWFGSDLKIFQFVHNVNLVGSSFAMLVGVLYEAYNRSVSENSMLFLFCEDSSTAPASGAIYYWSYIYYLSKYYELLDTVLQIFRGKPPPHYVLHVYHHAAVLFMAWAWLETKQSLQFIGLAFNTAVHVVMYTYFLQRTITSQVPRWKSFVTLFQIIQFMCSLLAFFVTIYLVFILQYECAGMNALYLNVLFNITLLHSFIGVFLKGKKRKKE